MHRDVVQVLAQVETRCPDAWSLQSPQIVLLELRWLGLLHIVIRDMGLTVEVRERGPLGRVGHHKKVPALEIRPGWCLEGDLDTACEHVRLHWSRQIEALADRASGRQEVIDGREVHGYISL